MEASFLVLGLGSWVLGLGSYVVCRMSYVVCQKEYCSFHFSVIPRLRSTSVRNKKPVIPSDSRGIWYPALYCSFTTQDPSASLRMTEFGFLSLSYLNWSFRSICVVHYLFRTLVERSRGVLCRFARTRSDMKEKNSGMILFCFWLTTYDSRLTTHDSRPKKSPQNAG